MEKLYPILFFALLFSACQRSAEVNSDGSGPPNVLLIMTDDQGYGDLSIHENDSLHTPIIDRLAEESVRFDRFYVSPVCAPTRASLLTGRYHLRTGTSWVTHRKEVMRSREVTIAEYLKEAGYRTGIFGKWHNGSQYPNDPLGQGFDEFVGFAAGHWNNYFNTTLTHNKEEIETQGYITDVLTDSAMAFIRNRGTEPFFCYVPFNAPHGPFQVEDKYFRNLLAQGLSPKNAAVYGMVENIDDNVGRLLQTLDEEGIAENTIVVFLTDNGPNGDRFNGGMRGRKAQVHEGGVRVPCFIRWPGHLEGGRMVEELAAHIDMLPTLMELTGNPLDTVRAIDGRSLVPLMTEADPSWEDRAIFTVMANGEPRLFPGSMRTSGHRMVINHSNTTELYDMVADFGQQNDIADSLPAFADSLRQVYEKWFLNVSPGAFSPPPISVGYPEAPLVELPAPEAKLEGEATFYGGMGWANDYIVGWKNSTDKASWPIYVVEPGNYRVSIAYTCTRGAVGHNVKVEASGGEAGFTIEEEYNPEHLPSPDRIDRGEVYEKVWKVQDAGSLKLAWGEQILDLRLDGGLTGEDVEIKAVYLQSKKTL